MSNKFKRGDTVIVNDGVHFTSSDKSEQFAEKECVITYMGSHLATVVNSEGQHAHVPFGSLTHVESKEEKGLLTGRPKRDKVIGDDDVMNLKILLNTAKSLEDFIAVA